MIAVDWSDDEEDLEGHGTAEYDPIRKWWVIEFDELGVRYVPAGNRDPVVEFRCVSCQQPLATMSAQAAFSPAANCPTCGTSALAPYAPPSIAMAI